MTTYAADTFTRSNGPVGNAETGGPWAATGAPSTWTVASDQLAGQSQSGYEGLLTLNDGQSDGAIQVTLVSGNSAGIVFRYSSTNNYWVLTFGANNYIRLSYMNNGYVRKADPGAVAAVGDVFRIELTGPTIIAYRNGKQLIGITDSSGAAATSHGLLTAGSTVAVFDSFSHASISGTPTPPPVPGPPPTATVHRYFNVGGVAVPVS